LNRRWTSFSTYAAACPNVDLRCFNGLPLPPASTPAACLYGLPLLPAPTACLYGLPSSFIIIIVIVIVHFLFKRNIYLSLLYVIYVSFLEITFLFFSFQLCS
jgi:hypothetical protein